MFLKFRISQTFWFGSKFWKFLKFEISKLWNFEISKFRKKKIESLFFEISKCWNHDILKCSNFEFKKKTMFSNCGNFESLKIKILKTSPKFWNDVDVVCLILFLKFLSFGTLNVKINFKFQILETLKLWNFEIVKFWNFEMLKLWNFDFLKFQNFEI